MAKLNLNVSGSWQRILCLGAHCDDIEIGCGATLVELASRSPSLEVCSAIFCSDNKREMESRSALSMLLGSGAQVESIFGGFRDGYLPFEATTAKEFLVGVVRDFEPDIVITHSRGDLHQDHRFVAKITYQAMRTGLILEMEIPKYDGDLGRPNVYFPVSRKAAEHKVATILKCYESQRDKDWFTKETFDALLRLRGIECRSGSGLAEAYTASKIVIT